MVMPWRCACSCTCDACAAASDWLIGVASALFTSAVAIVPERALGSNQLVRILEQLAHTRGLPKAIRTDNELNAIGVLQKEQAHSGCQSSPKNSVASTFAKGGFGLLLELFTLSTQLLIASELKRTRLDAPAPGEQRV